MRSDAVVSSWHVGTCVLAALVLGTPTAVRAQIEACDSSHVIQCPAVPEDAPSGMAWLYVAVSSSANGSGPVSPPDSRLRYRHTGATAARPAHDNPACHAIAVPVTESNVTVHPFIVGHAASRCQVTNPTRHRNPEQALHLTLPFLMGSWTRANSRDVPRFRDVSPTHRSEYVRALVESALEYSDATGDDVMLDVSRAVDARPEVLALEYLRTRIGRACTAACLDRAEFTGLPESTRQWLVGQRDRLELQVRRERAPELFRGRDRLSSQAREFLLDPSPRAALPELDEVDTWIREVRQPPFGDTALEALNARDRVRLMQQIQERLTRPL